ncbi:hypothetical protein AMTRI_Chr08g205950 [Amborella trichopoda]
MVKNYCLWSFQIKRFLMGWKLWGYLDGSVLQLKDENERSDWLAINSFIVIWIMNSVEPTIGRNLTYQSSAKAMWDYLQKIYSQANIFCMYTLKQDSMKTRQGDSPF